MTMATRFALSTSTGLRFLWLTTSPSRGPNQADTEGERPDCECDSTQVREIHETGRALGLGADDRQEEGDGEQQCGCRNRNPHELFPAVAELGVVDQLDRDQRQQ